MKIRVGIGQTRQSAPYETNRYSVEIEDDVQDNEIDDPRVASTRLFAIARKIVQNQKTLDGIE